jgi:hypothetical protein
LTYFTDVFTKETWSAFVADGGRVTAFSASSMRRGARNVRSGDRFVCYLKGEFSFVGALEARSEAFLSDEPVWGLTEFPVRVNVEPYALFPLDSSLPLAVFEGKLSFYPQGGHRSMVPPYFQGSPRALGEPDGDAIWRAILAHEDGVRSMLPSPRSIEVPEPVEPALASSRHAETQALLAELGLATGCSVWVPRADRMAVGRANPDIPEQLLPELPFLFGGKPQQVVQNIDTIWLQGQAVVAAFEVESTTSIYSGLLRMSDLVSLIPNINFPMYIVAPELRRPAVRDEILRPTFARLETPLRQKCGFLSMESLIKQRSSLGDEMLRYLRPGFINGLAEYFPEEK